MHVTPRDEADAAMLAAHLEWEKLANEQAEVELGEPHELGLCPFAAGWEAGREYERNNHLPMG